VSNALRGGTVCSLKFSHVMVLLYWLEMVLNGLEILILKCLRKEVHPVKNIIE